jgi:hypothetical protein
MSMSRKLFIPKAGQVHGRFAAFRLSGTANYRGDCVFLDTTAPASQGASGVLAGETLGTNDFLYVKSAQVANGATTPHAAVVGLIEGKAVGDRNTSTALTDDGVVVVQVAGVHTDCWQSATTATAGWVALADANSTLGAVRPIIGVGITTDAAIFAQYMVGVCLTDRATTGTRGTATTTDKVTLWIRCGDVV